MTNDSAPPVVFCPYCGIAAVRVVKLVPRCANCRAVFFVQYSRHMRRASVKAAAAMDAPAWCCEEGQALGLEVCDGCAETSAAYSAAMGPRETVSA
jgi:hypothetical protein